MPVLSHMVGPGWGMVSPPHQGMLAFVLPDMGDANHGVVIGMSYNVTDKPPQAPAQMSGNQTPVDAGEICFVSKAGAVLRLCADGSIYIKGPVVIEGPLTVKNDIVSTTGNITAQKGDVSDKHGSLDRLRGNYDAHRHNLVQSGNGVSGPTDHNDPE
jgi:phage gp45-like